MEKSVSKIFIRLWSKTIIESVICSFLYLIWIDLVIYKSELFNIYFGLIWLKISGLLLNRNNNNKPGKVELIIDYNKIPTTNQHQIKNGQKINQQKG